MKKMKKLFSLVLAFAMIFAMTVPTMAAEDDYIITITNANPENVSSGHTYEAYQILDGTVSADGSKLSDITWGTNIDYIEFIETLVADTNLLADGVTSVASHFSELDAVKEDVNASATKFAELFSASSFGVASNVEYIAGVMSACLNENDPVATSTETSAPYKIAIPKDKAGYYLVKDEEGSLDGKLDKDYTEFILRVAGNVQVAHKGSVPTIDKKVSEVATSGYGDAIDTAMANTYYYRVTGTLPSDYAEYDHYQYIITDTMSAGITFGEITRVYVLHRGGTTTDLTENTHYTVSKPGDEGVTENKLTITFENLKISIPSLLSTDSIVVEYTAKLNENAVIAGTGNANEVQLEYSNNPNTDGTGYTTPDKTDTYTFKLKLVKVDATTQNPLAGVTFYLYRQINVINEEGVSAQNVVMQYAVVENGKIVGWTQYKVAEDVPEGTVSPVATLLSTDANGIIDVSGLDASVYYLDEVTTLDGYNVLLDDIRVTVNATYQNGLVTAVNAETTYGTVQSLSEDNKVVGIELTVPNHQGEVLPTTGGIGTTLFYVFGSVMVIFAVTLLVTKKRMQQ